MIDPQTVDRLHALVRRESLSILMYVSQAFPWTTEKQLGNLAEVKRIIEEESAAIGNLRQYLARQASRCRGWAPFRRASPRSTSCR